MYTFLEKSDDYNIVYEHTTVSPNLFNFNNFFKKSVFYSNKINLLTLVFKKKMALLKLTNACQNIMYTHN
jgi:hypothetical protein